MLLRMKVLVAAVCLCIVPAVAHPSGGAPSASSSSSPKTAPRPTSFFVMGSNNKNKKRGAAPWGYGASGHHGSSIFRVINLSKSSGMPHNYEMNEIPAETRSLFTADPALRTKEARQQQYFAGSPNEIPVPPHVARLLHDILFFDTIDHAKLIATLQRKRNQSKLPPQVYKSLRPYFPFFSYE